MDQTNEELLAGAKNTLSIYVDYPLEECMEAWLQSDLVKIEQIKARLNALTSAYDDFKKAIESNNRVVRANAIKNFKRPSR